MNEILQLNIEKRLRAKGMMQKDLIEILGISKNSYYKRVNGNITISNLQQIAEALDCEAPDLLIKPDKKIVSADAIVATQPQPTHFLACPVCGHALAVTTPDKLK
jgi:DNA-binding Xre family transcriptional regulator